MQVVVTGGTGFLGSHVADVLAEAGHDVTIVDASPTDRHRYVHADLLDVSSLESAFRGAEAICHLAAVGDVYLAADRPALAAQTNVAGSAHVCDAALRADVTTVVCASTWEVYGAPQYEPLDEGHPTNPDHPYNITKLAGERLAIAYAHLRGLRVIALRLGTSYGTRMRPNSVFRIFISRALAGQPIVIQGSGQQGRQFTHASDVGRAFAAALRKPSAGPVYNIVADRLVTIRELAEMIAQFAPTEISYGEARPGDVPSALVTAALAARELDWRAVEVFEDGLSEMVKEARDLRA